MTTFTLRILRATASPQTTHDKVKRRIMQLLKTWSESFKRDESLGIVEETYEQLRKTHRYEDSASTVSAADPVPHSVLKQEEEDMQRAIAESEAMARNQQAGRHSGYVPSGSAATASTSTSTSNAPITVTQFFTQADGKALPDISSSQQGQPQTGYQQPGPAAQTPNKNPSRVKALYDFEPAEEGELAFRRGDIIRVVNSAYEGWWKGELDGRIGIFPITYIVSPEQAFPSRAPHLESTDRMSFPPRSFTGSYPRSDSREHSQGGRDGGSSVCTGWQRGSAADHAECGRRPG